MGDRSRLIGGSALHDDDPNLDEDGQKEDINTRELGYAKDPDTTPPLSSRPSLLSVADLKRKAEEEEQKAQRQAGWERVDKAIEKAEFEEREYWDQFTQAQEIQKKEEASKTSSALSRGKTFHQREKEKAAAESRAGTRRASKTPSFELPDLLVALASHMLYSLFASGESRSTPEPTSHSFDSATDLWRPGGDGFGKKATVAVKRKSNQNKGRGGKASGNKAPGVHKRVSDLGGSVEKESSSLPEESGDTASSLPELNFSSPDKSAALQENNEVTSSMLGPRASSPTPSQSSTEDCFDDNSKKFGTWARANPQQSEDEPRLFPSPEHDFECAEAGESEPEGKSNDLASAEGKPEDGGKESDFETFSQL
ncbi:uncharacterized protein LY89DRAFT_676752 [Mollisia scopiformis]|uniref:Uncharacterized protein n=1 Tax=Mollisia scopiformis TaxID=149040 RepID=A0A132B8Y1_MOLSC|nr:uncharacterized protein LY89DRAFT_676752 [Mollisia scopiformis]KUJ08862.1 hypothetical protein LY89DRAFT_676752 [Mollisia scopiformis]